MQLAVRGKIDAELAQLSNETKYLKTDQDNRQLLDLRFGYVAKSKH